MNVVIPIILGWLSGVLMVIAFFMSVSDDEYDNDEEE